MFSSRQVGFGHCIRHYL